MYRCLSLLEVVSTASRLEVRAHSAVSIPQYSNSNSLNLVFVEVPLFSRFRALGIMRGKQTQTCFACSLFFPSCV